MHVPAMPAPTMLSGATDRSFIGRSWPTGARTPALTDCGPVIRGMALSLLAVAAGFVSVSPASAAAAPKERGFELSSWSVPVSTPDEEGNPVLIDTDVHFPKPSPRPGGAIRS